MNKVILAIVAVLVITAGAAVFLLSSNDENSVSNAENTTPSSQTEAGDSADTTAEAEDEQSDVAAGQYIEFSEESLAATADTNRVVFFHAEWCSTCKFYEKDIMSTGVPAGITILEVDYDTSSELKEKYGVTIQSTFVLLDQNGEVVKTWPFAAGLQGAQDLFDAVNAEV